MLIKTKIIFADEAQSDLLGKDVNYSDEILLDMGDVSAVMPGNQDGSSSIIFLHGRDLLISESYKKVSFWWMTAKDKQEKRFLTKQDEG